MWSEHTFKQAPQRCTKRTFDSQERLRRLLEAELTFKRNRIMQPPSQELPRLSSALRAFGGVSSHLSREAVWFDENLLRRKQKRKKEATSSEKSWKDVVETVSTQCIKEHISKASNKQWCAFIRTHNIIILKTIHCLKQVQAELKQLQQDAKEIGTVAIVPCSCIHLHFLPPSSCSWW